MKVKLLRDARIKHKAGEIIEVSPEECYFLVTTDGAVEVETAVKAPAANIETPEEKLPEVEVPEKTAKTTKTAVKKPIKKTVAKKK